ncbi:MAG: TIGR03067 domain-containing protein [Planctomycetes bacterium]|nr:TIGR03067 domain-containing protein [Planctomycetota bacterium]
MIAKGKVTAGGLHGCRIISRKSITYSKAHSSPDNILSENDSNPLGFIRWSDEPSQKQKPKIQRKEKVEKNDLSRLQGDWVIVAAWREDKRGPDFVGRKMRIEKGILESFNKTGESELRGTITLRADKEPKEIDLEFTKNNKKTVFPGIYAFDKQKLHLAWPGRRGAERPKQFRAAGSDQVRVFILERKKEKKLTTK